MAKSKRVSEKSVDHQQDSTAGVATTRSTIATDAPRHDGVGGGSPGGGRPGEDYGSHGVDPGRPR